MYSKGNGVNQDDKQAFEWYQKAANQGLALAQNNLGWMYHQGRGVEQDFQQAKICYQKVLAQPDTPENPNIANIKALARENLQELERMGIR